MHESLARILQGVEDHVQTESLDLEDLIEHECFREPWEALHEVGDLGSAHARTGSSCRAPTAESTISATRAAPPRSTARHAAAGRRAAVRASSTASANALELSR